MGDPVLDRFAFHAGTEVTIPKHERMRTIASHFAEAILEDVPAGRHQALALTSLQETMMWANAGIAIETPKPTGLASPGDSYESPDTKD